MFEVMARLFFNKQVKFEKGRLELMGIRDCFTPLATYIEIQKSIATSVGDNLIYSISKEAGYNWFANMSKIFPRLTQIEAINWGLKIVSLSGWGIPSLEKIKLNEKSAIFLLRNSTVAKYYGKTDFPVDYIFSGLVAGGMSFILKSDLDCIEITCVAKGDKFCRFVVGLRKDLMPHYK